MNNDVNRLTEWLSAFLAEVSYWVWDVYLFREWETESVETWREICPPDGDVKRRRSKSTLKIFQKNHAYQEIYQACNSEGEKEVVRHKRAYKLWRALTPELRREFITDPEVTALLRVFILGVEKGRLAVLHGGDEEIEELLRRFNSRVDILVENPDCFEALHEVMKAAENLLRCCGTIDIVIGPLEGSIFALKQIRDGNYMPMEQGEDFNDLPDSLKQAIERTNYYLRKVHAQHMKALTEKGGPPEENESVQTGPNPIRWKGTDADLVELFVTLRERRYIQARSEYDVFKQLVQHFTGKGDKQLKQEGLKSTWSQRRNSGNRTFDSIPFADAR